VRELAVGRAQTITGQVGQRPACRPGAAGQR